MADADIRDQLLKATAALSSELTRATERLAGEMDRAVTALRGDKLDKAAIATALTDMASRLSGDGRAGKGTVKA
jgi:hypothetical protein